MDASRFVCDLQAADYRFEQCMRPGGLRAQLVAKLSARSHTCLAARLFARRSACYCHDLAGSDDMTSGTGFMRYLVQVVDPGRSVLVWMYSNVPGTVLSGEWCYSSAGKSRASLRVCTRAMDFRGGFYRRNQTRRVKSEKWEGELSQIGSHVPRCFSTSRNR